MQQKPSRGAEAAKPARHPDLQTVRRILSRTLVFKQQVLADPVIFPF